MNIKINIIFFIKISNSVVGPIFNKKFVKKCNLWDREQYTYALFTVDKVNYCGLEKKKKKEENVEKKRRRSFHCKPNGHGVSFTSKTCCFIKFSKLNTSQTARSWKLQLQGLHPMIGRVSSMAERLSRKVWFGELEGVNLSMYGVTIGCQELI